MKNTEFESGLMNVLGKIFKQKAPVEVQTAAISVMVRMGRNNKDFKILKPYLETLLDRADWEIKKAAWQAYIDLELEIDAEQKANYARACFAQLDKTKEKIYRESVTDQMDSYTSECKMILKQIAVVENLSLLLRHRFNIGLQYDVREMIDQIAGSKEEPGPETRQALNMLREPDSDKDASIDRLLSILKNGDDLLAAAAGHKLEKLGGKLPAKKLEELLFPGLPLDRLNVVAHLAKISNNKSLAKQIEQLVRIHIRTVSGLQARESISGIILSLLDLERNQGTRLGLVADSIFWTEHQSAQPGYFPWTKVFDRLYPATEDYEMLLEKGGDDARAAVHWLFSKSVISLVGARTLSPTRLGDKSLKQFKKLAELEKSLVWQHYFVGAAAKIHATELLPWLIALSENPELIYRQIQYSHERFGEFSDCYLATVYRSIGYLSQVLVKEGKDAAFAIVHLENQFNSITPNTSRKVIVGLATALGYLGKWEPILLHLNPPVKDLPELWMHEAAENILRYWLPGTSRSSEEKGRAGSWIGNHLRNNPGLDPEVRSVLEHIKEIIELELGYTL